MDAFEMRMDSTLLAQQSPFITYRQIAAVRLLQLSSLDLEAAVTQEQVTNPALEAEIHHGCLRCGTPLDGASGVCPACGAGAGASTSRLRGDWDDLDGDSRGGPWEDDGDDALLRVPAAPVRGGALLALLRLAVAARDVEIAEYLVASLDSHGFLSADIVPEAASVLGCAPGRVRRALAALQALDPPGIGARGARECLLIQLARLREAGEPHPLAERLVRDHLKPLAFRRFREVAHAAGLMPKKVEAEWAFIHRRLNPFPAHGFEAALNEPSTTAAPVTPDVIIRRRGDEYAVEVVERQRYTLRVSPGYLDVRRHLAALGCGEADRAHVRGQIEQAQSFITALRPRWETMQRVTEALIVAQRDYLEHGEAALKPLTRADIAHTLGLHESTVSRATDGKYAQLPDGRTVAYDAFFDSSLPVRDALRALIAGESPYRPLSDEHLTRLLRARGLTVARRTIAKYREEMRILPSRLRRQRLPARAARALAASSAAPKAMARAAAV